jgi:MFS family permease
MNQLSKLAGMLGFAGSAMGLFAGFALGSIRLGLINVNPGVDPRPGPSVELPGNLGFLFACTLPFALALVALRFQHPSWRVATWLGVSLLAFAVAFSPLSIATFLLLPLPALLLGLAAVLTWRETRGRDHLPMLLIAIVVAIFGGLAGILLFSLPDAQCWVLIRSANGQETWESIPYTTSLTVGPGPGPVAESCASDIISPLEATMSVSVWVVTVIGLALVLPRAFPKQLE